MSKADEIREKRERDRARQAALTTDTDAGTTQGARTSRGSARANGGARKVRRTVDLGSAHHRELGAWCDRAADELGVTRITGQDVLSALVARLLTDDVLSEALIRDLRANQ